MTAEEYIDQQCQAFLNICQDMNYDVQWGHNLSDIILLDDARDKAIEVLWPDGTPEALENAVAIAWGAMFSKAIAGSYVTRWSVDTESKTPVVVVKCGTKAMQVKALLVGAQSFNNGQLFVDTWQELEKTLTDAGAEKL